jgi:hypothetical protein
VSRPTTNGRPDRSSRGACGFSRGRPDDRDDAEHDQEQRPGKTQRVVSGRRRPDQRREPDGHGASVHEQASGATGSGLDAVGSAVLERGLQHHRGVDAGDQRHPDRHDEQSQDVAHPG